MGEHILCTRCLASIYEENERISREGKAIEVCTCGHGSVHHTGIIGDCTCPITFKDTKCKCQEFVLAWGIWNHIKMTAYEYYLSLQPNSEVKKK
jgi:hypothetical protein